MILCDKISSPLNGKFHETHKQSNSERVVTNTAKTKMSLKILM